MWFLTQEGMDRYDGKRIRHYTVLDGNLKVAPQVNLNWLYTDTENTLWVVGRKGRILFSGRQPCKDHTQSGYGSHIRVRI